eukprot:6551791-Prymnesium_polylepis.1
MARRVDHVVDAPRDPVIAVGVAPAAVAREVVARVLALDREVGRDVTVVVAHHGADCRRPRPLDREEALARPVNLHAVGRDQHRLHPEEGEGCRARLLAPTFDGKRRDHDATRLGLPP